MSNNQQLVTFPFRPHLAHYLFYSLTNQVLYDEDFMYRHVDVDLKSYDGKYLRTLLERIDYPKIKKAKDGFRLTISIPRNQKEYYNVMEDGKYAELDFPQEAITLINDYYEARFRDSMVCFVAGWTHGNKHKRGSVEPAIKVFMKIYHLFDQGFTVDQFIQYYKRRNSPLKSSVYAKNISKTIISESKKSRKSLMDNYIKK